MKNKTNRPIFSLLTFCLLLGAILANSSRASMAGPATVQASGPQPASVPATEPAAFTDQTVANCRYGTVAGLDQEQHVSRVGAGWFLDFNPPRPIPPIANDAEFVHVFRVFQRKTQDGQYLPFYRTDVPLDQDLAAYIRANPGDLWLIGNEVDRGPNPGQNWSGQGDMFPDIYAWAYHDVRAFIKSHDPTARIAISGLVQVTPGRLQYLNMVWHAYQQRYGTTMPVDVWNMHVYVLPEVESDGVTPNGIAGVAVGTNPALGKRSSDGSPLACDDPDVYCFAEHDDLEIFSEQVLAMRRWMKDHGQQQKPLILSEYSLLYPYIEEGDGCFLQDEMGRCFTPDRVQHFMTSTFTYLNQLQDADLGYALDGNRLVQQWNWYSVFTENEGTVSNLLQADEQTLSSVGITFQQAVYAEAPTVNLLIEDIPKAIAIVDPATGRATAKLRVIFRNNGNTAINEPFKVTFYLDPGRTKPLGSVLMAEPVRGCATNVYTAELDWPNLQPGVHFYWLALDSDDEIAETPPNPAGNLGFGLVKVFTASSLLPVVAR